jgi:hypothetical protein
VPEIIDTVFAKTSPKRSFSMTEYKRFGLVFTKTWVYKFGHWKILTWTNVTFCVEFFLIKKILKIAAILTLAEV